MRKLEDYIGKRIIIKVRDEHGKFMLGGGRKYPFTLKKVNKDFIKVEDEAAGITHDIQFDNLYLVWERENNTGFGFAKKGKVIYASEENIFKRGKEIERLGSWIYYTLIIFAEILMMIAIIVAIINFAIYIESITPYITSTQFSNSLITIVQNTGPGLIVYGGMLTTLGLISLPLLFWFLMDIIKMPLREIESRYENEYIQLLEWKADISLDGEN